MSRNNPTAEVQRLRHAEAAHRQAHGTPATPQTNSALRMMREHQHATFGRRGRPEWAGGTDRREKSGSKSERRRIKALLADLRKQRGNR